ncbi:MAG TPA: hypothetical protein VG370_28255 [Chloroflexota bacterium]|jgi:hypothetical protein|nr:hypothetical protein [Chloroflexota bacterium]
MREPLERVYWPFALPRARADLFVLTRRPAAVAIPVEVVIGVGRSIVGQGGGVLTG